MYTPDKRPDHPDFWKMSQIIIDCDAQAEEQGLDEVLDGYVDKDALVYMANQRAYRALNIQRESELQDAATRESVSIIAAMWMDAFIVGAKYERKIQDGTETGIGSPLDPRL